MDIGKNKICIHAVKYQLRKIPLQRYKIKKVEKKEKSGFFEN
jgi:hypothetical protein